MHGSCAPSINIAFIFRKAHQAKNCDTNTNKGKNISIPIVSISGYNSCKNQATNKHYATLDSVAFIGGLVFAAVITAYAYNGDTNIFTFIGVGITICSFLRFPKSECLVDWNNTESMHSYNDSELHKYNMTGYSSRYGSDL